MGIRFGATARLPATEDIGPVANPVAKGSQLVGQRGVLGSQAALFGADFLALNTDPLTLLASFDPLSFPSAFRAARSAILRARTGPCRLHADPARPSRLFGFNVCYRFGTIVVLCADKEDVGQESGPQAEDRNDAGLDEIKTRGEAILISLSACHGPSRAWARQRPASAYRSGRHAIFIIRTAVATARSQ